MWAVAGVLLGAFFLTSILGFHLGPHGHVAGSAIGLAAAGWLALIAFTGESSALLWTLFGADLMLTTGVGLLAWKGLTAEEHPAISHRTRILGELGVATTDLTPEGTVRVRGEEWSSTSMNGNVPKGATVQVIGLQGIHLEVWAEESNELDQGASQ